MWSIIDVPEVAGGGVALLVDLRSALEQTEGKTFPKIALLIWTIKT